MRRTVLRNSAGVSLVEVLISFVIFSVVSLALLRVSVISVDQTVKDSMRDEAVSVAETRMNEARGIQYSTLASDNADLSTDIQATVTAVDKEKRTVTVKGPRGKTKTLTVGKEARNFDQVKVGDMITLTYMEALTVSLEKAEGAKPGKTVTEELKRAAPGEKPGGHMQRQATVVGTVTAINGKTQMVTVRGPDGNEVDLKVEDAAKLKNVKIGDLVKATYTEAVAVSVSTPAKPAAAPK